jgi:hypothetical protein
MITEIPVFKLALKTSRSTSFSSLIEQRDVTCTRSADIKFSNGRKRPVCSGRTEGRNRHSSRNAERAASNVEYRLKFLTVLATLA